MKICPFCDGEINDDVIRCRHCSMVLPRPKVTKQGAPEQKVPPPEVAKITEETPTPSEPPPPPELPPQQSTFSTPNIEEKAAIAVSKPSSQQSTVSTPIIEETKAIPESISRPSPRQSTVGAPRKEETKIKAETLYEAFIGKKKHAYYLNKFKKFDEQTQGLKASWNWAAFFGSYLWAFYRKMYGWFFACFGLVAFLTIYPYYLKYYKGSAPQVYSALLYICMITFSIFFGTIGNSLYYRAVKKKIAATQSSITDKTELLEFLRNKGGVHTWILWFCILGLIFLLFAGAFNLDINTQEIDYSYLPIYAAMIIGIIVAIIILYSNINLEWEMKLEEIGEDYKGHIIAAIIVIPIITLAASLLITISDQNKKKEQASVAQPAIVTDQSTGPTFEEALEKIAKERRYNAIISAHPDFDSLRDSGKILAWVQKQPKHLQDQMLKTYDEGDADSVIALLNQFKNSEKSAQLRKQTPKKSISVTSRPEYSDRNYKAIGGGIKGIKLKNGNIIEGELISFDGNIVIIRTKDGKVSSYMFMEEVSWFIY